MRVMVARCTWQQPAEVFGDGAKGEGEAQEKKWMRERKGGAGVMFVLHDD